MFRKIYDFNLNRPANEKLDHFKVGYFQPSRILLKKSFRKKFDTTNQEILDVANFKTVLLRSEIDISFQDINRIVRFLDQEKFMIIDYINYFKRVKNSSSLPNGKGQI